MSYLTTVIDDLRQKRLWPVAAVLVVALVAVPALLSTSAKSTPVAAAPTPAPSGATGPALPTVRVNNAAIHTHLRGHGRDPFKQPHSGKASSATTSTTTTTASGAGSTGSGGSGATGSGTSTTATTPTTTTPTAPPTTTTTTTTTTTPQAPPTPPGLTDTQSYAVTFAITNDTGGLDTIDPLERLSVLPGARQPLLVYLGVLKGGHRVLFAVRPGAFVKGPGDCAPGRVDCEVLSLAVDQIETLSNGDGSSAQFAITAIKAADHPSTAAADKARRTESAPGRRLLDRSSSRTLSLFRYEPDVGAVIDLRNVAVGGN
jgi:hypothetical protein